MDFSDPVTSPNFYEDPLNSMSIKAGFMESQLLIHDQRIYGIAYTLLPGST